MASRWAAGDRELEQPATALARCVDSGRRRAATCLTAETDLPSATGQSAVTGQRTRAT